MIRSTFNGQTIDQTIESSCLYPQCLIESESHLPALVQVHKVLSPMSLILLEFLLTSMELSGISSGTPFRLSSVLRYFCGLGVK